MPEESQKNRDREYYFFALRIIGDFGVSLAAPVVVFVLIGQWLDAKYSTSPRFTIAAFVIAALTSANIIYKKAKRYGKEYQEIDRKKL